MDGENGKSFSIIRLNQYETGYGVVDEPPELSSTSMAWRSGYRRNGPRILRRP